MKLNRKTIANDEPFLRQVSTDVDFENDDYLDWIARIKHYCQHEAVYALAPVQIGIPKRIIYLRNTSSDMDKNKDSNYDEEKVLINPVIISMKGHTQFLERCASCLDYVGIVDRPYSVEVEYFTIDGKRVQETFEEFKATVFCHEYDHLNGVLHIDLSPNVEEMSLEETRAYRLNNPLRIISKDGEYKTRKRKLEDDN